MQHAPPGQMPLQRLRDATSAALPAVLLGLVLAYNASYDYTIEKDVLWSHRLPILPVHKVIARVAGNIQSFVLVQWSWAIVFRCSAVHPDADYRADPHVDDDYDDNDPFPAVQFKLERTAPRPVEIWRLGRRRVVRNEVAPEFFCPWTAAAIERYTAESRRHTPAPRRSLLITLD